MIFAKQSTESNNGQPDGNGRCFLGRARENRLAQALIFGPFMLY